MAQDHSLGGGGEVRSLCMVRLFSSLLDTRTVQQLLQLMAFASFGNKKLPKAVGKQVSGGGSSSAPWPPQHSQSCALFSRSAASCRNIWGRLSTSHGDSQLQNIPKLSNQNPSNQCQDEGPQSRIFLGAAEQRSRPCWQTRPRGVGSTGQFLT